MSMWARFCKTLALLFFRETEHLSIQDYTPPLHDVLSGPALGANKGLLDLPTAAQDNTCRHENNKRPEHPALQEALHPLRC